MHGIATGLQRDSVVIDMSSSAPVGTRELGAVLAGRGVHLVDAPVSGGVKKAMDGTLAIMVGGKLPVIERCRSILDVFGRVFVTGGPGTGHAMKAINNYLSAAHLATAAEGIIAGTRFGIEPKSMVEILNHSSGRSYSTEYKYPQFILPGKFDAGFSLGLMAKDVRLALDLARANGAPHELLQAVADTWNRAEQQLGPRADHTEIVKFLESLVGEPTHD
jgi:3-hydroxyisobutyrate dehydrogenase